jgi:hypothetical protein
MTLERLRVMVGAGLTFLRGNGHLTGPLIIMSAVIGYPWVIAEEWYGSALSP